ncbi:TonB-dependent receptor [Alphaproteobacteria bacterium]|nr:TonB-dependent receptor [Alphaproteobacteria bacterium]
MLLGVSVVAMTAVTSAAGAQEAADATDEVVVTGIRSSLERAMDVKRDAKGVVESITAEDMGKFPDSNLAESLQRVSGVSIDRSNSSGEGQYVTVRGFGADYNLVTYNDRSMPVSTLGNFASAPSTRSFDFGNLAPEAVSRVDIYKTGKAHTASGGVGSTININTTRPLDMPGFAATVGVKKIFDESQDSGSNDEISALVYNTWADGKLGFSISAVSNNLSHTVASYRQGWSAFEPFGALNLTSNDELGFPNTNPNGEGWHAGALAASPAAQGFTAADCTLGTAGNVCPWPAGFNPDVVVNPPANDVLISNVREGSGYYVDDLEQNRDNFQVTFQARPFDNLTATVDYLSAEMQHEVFESRLTVWIDDANWQRYGMETKWGEGNPAQPVYAKWTQPGGNTWGRVDPAGVQAYWRLDDGGTYDGLDTIAAHSLDNGTGYDDLDNSQMYQNNLTDLESVGINLEWDVNERLSLELDFHSSESESSPLSQYGSSASIASISKTFDQTTWDYTKEIPVISLRQKAPYDTLANGTDPLYAPGRFLAGGTNVNSFMKNEVDQLQVTGSFDPTDTFLSAIADEIDFGVSEITNEVSYAFGEIQAGNWGGIGADYDVIGTTGAVGSAYDNALWSNRDNLRGYFNELGGGNEVFPEIIRADYRDWFAAAQARINVVNNDADAGNNAVPLCGDNQISSCLAPYDQFNNIEEETVSYYVQASKDFTVYDMEANVTFGVRHEETDVTSSSVVPEYSHILWTSGTDMEAVATGNSITNSRTASYDNTLPSFDFSMDVLDNLKVRASYSETIARQGYDNLKGGTTIQKLVRSNKLENGQTGTGSSGNPGLEPLESENTDFSVEYYYGDLSYLSVGYFSKDVSGYVGTGKQYVTSQGLTNPAFTASGGPVVFDDTGTQQGGASNELAIFEVSGPALSDRTETIDGIELTIQHDFADADLFGLSLDGFGVIANYTIVDSDADYKNTTPNSQSATQFAIVGISDSANLIGYYEDEDVSVRVAYNWRDRFLNFSGGSSGYTEEYESVDMNVSYNIDENISLTYDGINLTEEGRRTFERNNPAYVTWVSQGHAKHFVGLRWKY